MSEVCITCNDYKVVKVMGHDLPCPTCTATSPTLAADRDALRAQLTAALKERDEAQTEKDLVTVERGATRILLKQAESSLLAAQVEIGGLMQLKGACDNLLKVMLRSKTVKPDSATEKQVMQQEINAAFQHVELLTLSFGDKPTVNASAGERVRGVLDLALARQEIIEQLQETADDSAEERAPGIAALNKLEDDLTEALAALKEADRG